MVEEREKTEMETVGSSGDTSPNVPLKPKKVSSMATRKTQARIFIFAVLCLPILHWIVSWIFININSFVMAFQDNYGNFTLSNFSEVYERLFNPDEGSSLPIAIKNSVFMFFSSEFIGVPISLVVSYFISKKIWGYKIFRTIFYLPHVITGIVMVLAFKQLVSPLGPIASWCNQVGIALPEEGLVHTEATAVPTIVFYGIWTGACGNVLFYTAMARIPPELTDVGRLEGLRLFKELIYVIMPLIWPTFSTTLILDLTGILNAGGGVLIWGVRDVIQKARATTVPYWFFSQVYDSGTAGIGSYGVMSCVGLCLTAISVPFTMFIRWLVNKVPTGEF